MLYLLTINTSFLRVVYQDSPLEEESRNPKKKHQRKLKNERHCIDQIRCATSSLEDMRRYGFLVTEVMPRKPEKMQE